jgi:hypothetical protein
MNAEDFLQRLFSLVRRLPAEAVPEPPYGWETSILAHWRETVARRKVAVGLVRGLRWAALMACAVALLAGVMASDELAAFRSRNDPEARIADSALVAGYGYE